MSNIKLPESPIAKQYPIWSSKDNIEMSGLEFQSIYNLLNLLREAVIAGETILQNNIQNGKIKWKFEDAQGKEVPQHIVEGYQREIQAYFQAQQAAQQAKAPITAEEQKDLPKIDALVDATGKPINL